MATTGTPRRPSASPSPAPPSRSGRAAPRRPRRKTLWQRIKTFFSLVTFFVSLAVITALIAIGLQLKNLPQSINIAFDPPGRTFIYSSDGTLLARMYAENRQVVSIDRIPKNLQNATIAFEDRRFYSHQGFDVEGIGRALYRTVKSRGTESEGGSTITQQLARNVGIEGLTRERSIKRKIHELLVANQIEKSYTKQRILEMYLNLVNYGSGAYGVQAAAQTYFGKDVSKLDLAQCALIAGLPNRPAYFDPYKNKKAAVEQRDRVLDNMLEEHLITVQQHAKAKKEYMHLAGKRPPNNRGIFHAPQFVNYVVDQIKTKYGDDYLTRGNLKIYTTLNWPMQELAEKELAEGIDRANRYGPNQGCLVALDPKNGEIKAMVGSVDFEKSQFNIVTQGGGRQPGSLFKAVVYSAAIDSGLVTEDTRVRDSRVSYRSGGKWYTPKDDTGYSNRNITLREAMAYSVNVPAVKVLHDLGPQNAIRYARLMGIKSPLAPYLSLALGSSAVTPLEIAGVYGTIAAGGNYALPQSVTRLTDLSGKTIEDILPQIATEVIQKSTARQLDDMLSAVVTERRGTGAGASSIPNARGKTGTTQGHKDVWFVGYTPELVAAVWAGHPYKDPKTGADQYGMEMRGNAWGATVCVPIWTKFMAQAVPMYQQVLARKFPKAKPAAPPALPTPADDENAPPDDGRRHRRRHRDEADQTSADGLPASTASDDATPTPAGDGTVAANVDDNTGLLAPSGSPHSHAERFAPGAQPTITSPEYTPRPAPPTPEPPAVVIPRAPRASVPSIPTAPRVASHTAKRVTASKPAARTITVRINPDDNLLANKWTTYSVEKTYVLGRQPKRYTKMYGPPPGER